MKPYRKYSRQSTWLSVAVFIFGIIILSFIPKPESGNNTNQVWQEKKAPENQHVQTAEGYLDGKNDNLQYLEDVESDRPEIADENSGFNEEVMAEIINDQK